MLRTKVSLKNFFIFNSLFCDKEGQEERKILFYYPEIANNEKLKDVGFIEAIVKFTGSFSFEESNDVLTMKTLKTMRLFYEPEKDFWIVLTLNVPFERKEKDKKEYFEYYCDDVHEAVYKKVIQRAYRHFRLFCNSFDSNMVGESIDDKLQNMRERLDNFYTKYLLTMNLQTADIVDSIECIQYKPITHLIFFRIVNFMNMVTSIKTLHIKKCIFLYNNQEVIYSSLSPADLYILNEFLNESLFPKFIQRRNNQSFDADRSAGCFVMEHETDTIKSSPKIYLHRDGTRNEFDVYRLIIYSVLDVSLVMLIADAEEILGDELCNEIKYSIGPQLSLISKDITENSAHFQQQSAATKTQTPTDEALQEKYIYFNQKNSRVHACFYETENATKGRKTQLSTSVMNLLCDLYDSSDDVSKALISSEKEKIIKTYNDYWIIAKSYNSRNIYLILHKSSTLIDIAEEAQRLLSEIVKNVYFTNQQ